MWTIEKLQQYLTDQIEENLYLDYKASDSLLKTDGKKNEIAKDISSFANSDGGTIIYGIKEFQSGSTFLPEKIDPIKRDEFSKETLEQIINTRISPRIHGITITPISIGKLEDNQVVYVIDIPKSFTAHQASDKKYYRRFNFQSIPMDDWEIKDIINRQNKAIIEISFRPKFAPDTFEMYASIPRKKMAFDLLATNKGNKVVQYCDCSIFGTPTTAEAIHPKPPIKVEGNYFELYYTNTIEYQIPFQGEKFTINTQRDSILPQTYRKIGEIIFYSDFFIKNLELSIAVSLDDNRIVKKINGRELIKI